VLLHRCLPPDDVAFAALYHNLGGIEFSRGRYRAAERLAVRGLRIRRKQVGPSHPDVAADLSGLAAILHGQQRYRAALRAASMARQILGARRRSARLRHDLAVIDNNLGATLQALGRFAEAERSYRSSIRLKRAALGPRHPDVGVSLNNLGCLYKRLGRVAEARTAYASAIDILRAGLGARHPHTRNAIANVRPVLTAAGSARPRAAR
jgi:tetratricopeptide (TPR) repeat protein